MNTVFTHSASKLKLVFTRFISDIPFQKQKRMQKSKLMLWLSKNIFFIILFLVALCIGLFLSIFLFNKQQINRNQNIEITFVSPREAVVFWTTPNETLGYVRYTPIGKKTEVLYQTSSVLGTVHAVVISDIPLEGASISLHNDSDSRFLFITKRKLRFDPNSYVE